MLPILIIGLIVLAAISAGGYLLYQTFQSRSITTDPTNSQEEVRRLVEVVGKLIDLPLGEEPSVATITDIENLKSKPFFKNAKNGDKVLIYMNAQEAILFDPVASKVLDVASLNIGTISATPTSAPAVPSKIVLRNGTTTTGLTTRVETELRKTIPDLNVTTKENASKNDYTKTLIVVLNENAKETASRLNDTLKGSLVSLPAGESKPAGADILIILGKDRVQ